MATCRNVFFAAFVVHLAVATVVTSDAPAGPGTNRTLSYPKPWLADLFYNTLRDFAGPEDVGSSACRNQAQMYRKHLENGSHWAVQMSDSWTRYPTGVLVSTSHQMGVYDECVEVHRPVRGMYCLPSVRLKSTTGDDYTAGKPDEPAMNENAWREIIGFVNNDFVPHKNNVKFGICIPDSCTAQDLEVSLQKEFDKQFLPHRVKAEVRVESILCSTDKDMYPFDSGFYFTSILFGMILLTCGLSTVYHVIRLIQSNNEEKTYIMPELLSYFSIISNGKELFKYDESNSFNLFNGIKATIMIIVLFGHRIFYVFVSPMVYGKRIEMFYTPEPGFILTGMNLVDPFFYVTGCLLYMLMIPQFQKPGTNWLQVPMVIANKYLRTLPSHVMLILLTAFVIPHMGDGPIWASIHWPEAEKCKNYWWANILGVNNFMEPEHQCLIVSWYLSCLLQFLVIGTIVIYVCAKNRKIGIYLVVILFIVSMITPFVMTYYHRAYGIIRPLYSFSMKLDSSFEYRQLYRPFYIRSIPFFAGILGGIIAEKMKTQKIKFSSFVVYFGTLVVYFLCLWIQNYTGVSFKLHRPYDVLEQSIFSTVTHLTITTMVFWTTLCHLTSGYGPVEKIFNNPLMVILGRLSYSVYLVNITVIQMMIGKQRTATSITVDSTIELWISTAFKSYLAGTLIYLTIEIPYGLLIKKLLYGKTVDDRDSRQKNTTNVENVLAKEQIDLTPVRVH